MSRNSGVLSLVTSVLLALSSGSRLAGAAPPRKNVLFLVSDDMRPELTCYSGPDFPTPVHPNMHSPYLDALAAKSLLLKRAYVQQAVCSPSRTSLLTGRRPDTTHVYDLTHYFRNVGGNFTTIPQYFKENGYLSVGMGKIFHVRNSSFQVGRRLIMKFLFISFSQDMRQITMTLPLGQNLTSTQTILSGAILAGSTATWQ